MSYINDFFVLLVINFVAYISSLPVQNFEV